MERDTVFYPMQEKVRKNRLVIRIATKDFLFSKTPRIPIQIQKQSSSG